MAVFASKSMLMNSIVGTSGVLSYRYFNFKFLSVNLLENPIFHVFVGYCLIIPVLCRVQIFVAVEDRARVTNV